MVAVTQHVISFMHFMHLGMGWGCQVTYEITIVGGFFLPSIHHKVVPPSYKWVVIPVSIDISPTFTNKNQQVKLDVKTTPAAIPNWSTTLRLWLTGDPWDVRRARLRRSSPGFQVSRGPWRTVPGLLRTLGILQLKEIPGLVNIQKTDGKDPPC